MDTVSMLLAAACLMLTLQVTHCREVNFTMMMPDMTVNTSWIHDDCYNGVLSDIHFYTEYTFADGRAFCIHNSNPMVPIEWTDAVESLVMYNQRAQEAHTHCMMNRTCETINMSDWKQLAQEQYKACKYCVDEERNISACANYRTETNSTKVLQIINTMFLFVKYKCTLQQDEQNRLLILPVSSSSTVKVSQASFTCKSDEFIHVKHIVENAVTMRVRVGEDNSELVQYIQQSVASDKLGGVLEIPASYWTVHGGYYWGTNETRRIHPFCIILYYACVPQATGSAKIVSDPMPSTPHAAKQPNNEETSKKYLLSDQSVLTIGASAVVLVILTVTVVATSLTIRNMRKRSQRKAGAC